MALQKRRVINRCEILASGDIQVRETDEIYDDITNEVESRTFHRKVIVQAEKTPADVQTFLDNSKSP